MSLTTEDFSLLRKLIEWRRANGWTYSAAWDKPACDRDGAPMSEPLMRHTWESAPLPNGERANVEAIVVNGELWAVNYRPDYGDEMAHIAGGRGFLALARALMAAGVESLPWNYAVRESDGEIRNFGEDLEGAVTWALPIDGYPALTLLRWRQGRQQTAEVPS